MPSLKHDTFFRRHPVFTSEELSEHLSANAQVGSRARESLLSYYTKTGRLIRIRRGLYAVVPPDSDLQSHPVDPYLIVSKLTPDAVLSHHTALQFFGRAYSIWQEFNYQSERPVRKMTFRGHAFKGTRFPMALVRSGNQHFGVPAVPYSGMLLKVTSLERTLVDLLHRPWLSGGWEEVWRSLESVEFFDLDVVVEYCLLLENASITSRVGFYLEQHREELMVEERHLKELRVHRPRQPHYLDRSRRNSGRLFRDWNLVVPAEVVERSWSDVL